MRGPLRCCFVFACVLLAPAAVVAAAQAPRVAPHQQFVLHDERTAGVFTVQRWVNRASPEVSPAGMCECITVVYLGDRRVLAFGQEGLLSAMSVAEPSGRDITGDGSPELIVTDWSGGAHCCLSTVVYSVERPAGQAPGRGGAGAPREILRAETGSCTAMFEELDRDGRLELVTCQDGWEDDYCTFAEAPFAPVVFAYDAAKRVYAVATPRYRERYREAIAGQTKQAEADLRGSGRNAGLDKCTVLQPVLALLYTGRTPEGVALLRRLYRHPDARSFEQTVMATVKSSPWWIP